MTRPVRRRVGRWQQTNIELQYGAPGSDATASPMGVMATGALGKRSSHLFWVFKLVRL